MSSPPPRPVPLSKDGDTSSLSLSPGANIFLPEALFYSSSRFLTALFLKGLAPVDAPPSLPHKPRSYLVNAVQPAGHNLIVAAALVLVVAVVVVVLVVLVVVVVVV